ncbi:MAG: hypothetical protein ACN6OB_05470 [Chryseobacterium jejuense]|uniref:hypothetical protein n=1 Tax=Chryseobacterium jejuense TaxID=445960 RepID=UPI003D14F112
MNKLIAVSLLVFIGCHKKENNKLNQHNPAQSEEIRSLEVINFGGKFGVYSRISINHDSVHYSHKINTEPHKMEFSQKIKAEDWKNIINKIDLNAFRNVTEGKSLQPMDGIDTKIMIISNKDTLSKINAYDNPIWKSILENVHQYHQE